MLNNLFQIYKIGNDLGLSKKEIRKVFLFNNKEHGTLYTILLIIIAIVAVGFLIIFLGIQLYRSLYPSGALYSTIKKKDFRKKKGN